MSEMLLRVETEIRRAIEAQTGTMIIGGQCEAARAAIDAMREPTEAMIEAGRLPAEDDGPYACWEAMINTALKDHREG